MLRGSVVLLLALGVLSAPACSSGPSMSGVGLAGGRVVAVGDVVELRIPLRQDGSRQWRVTGFDSVFLELLSEPQPVRSASGDYELLTRARALRPGETTVELTEVLPTADRATRSPRTKQFSIRILG